MTFLKRKRNDYKQVPQMLTGVGNFRKSETKRLKFSLYFPLFFKLSVICIALKDKHKKACYLNKMHLVAMC